MRTPAEHIIQIDPRYINRPTQFSLGIVLAELICPAAFSACFLQGVWCISFTVWVLTATFWFRDMALGVGFRSLLLRLVNLLVL